MTQQLSSFEVGNTLLGVRVDYVQEIFRTGDIARVPLAPKHIAGLISLRGHILTVAHLGAWLGLPGAGPGRMTLVVQTRHGLLGLLVDEVGEVMDVSDEWADAPPEAITQTLRQAVQRVYRLPKSLLFQLEVDAMERQSESGSA